MSFPIFFCFVFLKIELQHCALAFRQMCLLTCSGALVPRWHLNTRTTTNKAFRFLLFCFSFSTWLSNATCQIRVQLMLLSCCNSSSLEKPVRQILPHTWLLNEITRDSKAVHLFQFVGFLFGRLTLWDFLVFNSSALITLIYRWWVSNWTMKYYRLRWIYLKDLMRDIRHRVFVALVPEVSITRTCVFVWWCWSE